MNFPDISVGSKGDQTPDTGSPVGTNNHSIPTIQPRNAMDDITRTRSGGSDSPYGDRNG